MSRKEARRRRKLTRWTDKELRVQVRSLRRLVVAMTLSSTSARATKEAFNLEHRASWSNAEFTSWLQSMGLRS